MTKKMGPEAFILIDFKLTDSELARLHAVNNAPFSTEDIRQFELVMGAYIGATLVFRRGKTPTRVSTKLKTTLKPLAQLQDIFRQFVGVNELDAVIFDSTNGMTIDGFSSLSPEDQLILGVSYEDADTAG
jgi:hypothetical protein